MEFHALILTFFCGPQSRVSITIGEKLFLKKCSRRNDPKTKTKRNHKTKMDLGMTTQGGQLGKVETMWAYAACRGGRRHIHW